MTNESVDDINVGVALTTALLLPGDLERNAGYSEYENYALMLQHSVQLVDLRREVSALKKENKTLLSKMKKLEDQTEAATKAQTLAEEKAESAEAIKTVTESQKKEAEARAAQAEKELQEALATKEAEIKKADEKAYAQGMANVTEDYKLQAEEESESESEAEDEDNNDNEALVRKSKDAAEAKTIPPTEQVMDLTLDEEGDEVGEAPKEAVTGQLSSDLLCKPRSSSATTSGSKKSDVPWAPQITLEDRPIMTNESVDDINVGVALTTALLLPGDLERNAGYSEYENYALMLQHSVQAEAATKTQTLAEENAESAEAIKTVAESQKKEAEARAAQAEKELQEASATKEAEIKKADKKAYAQGVANVTKDYKLQVRQAEEESESESEAEDEDNNDNEALVRKSKDAAEAKTHPPTEQVMDLTLDEEGDEVGKAPKEAVTGQLSSDLLLAERSLDKMLAEIDAELAAEKAAELADVSSASVELAAEKAAEVVPQESAEVQTQIAPETEES
ncbi:uncharacterized abhydrolase domain-containing protein DDB_G0269086-like [Camellia sinensis]|uniref:uncharacterized abhydrolase domain-containing protein DDB_G0269086-like n=1 Tax=Camellia sinensis TaxID=4442 RepID=UPI0010368A84|nr:uncharacterized abhydrolase domain-containing protein DDB_G0269086-like [Camellia sinensis]